MMNMGDQLEAILIRKMANMNVASDAVAVDLSDKMKQNTLQGQGFGSDSFDNTYTENYARRAKGGARSPVTLRNQRRRIEQTNISNPTRNSSRIAFNDDEGGRIFKLHHEGRARGGRVRSIWPKQLASIPIDTRGLAVQKAKEVLQP
jgi:hypothetical protein